MLVIVIIVGGDGGGDVLPGAQLWVDPVLSFFFF